MKKIYMCIVIGFILLLFSDLKAQKKPLTLDDIGSWNRITEKVISPDGNWIAYKIEPWRGDSKIYLCSKKGENRFESGCGKDIKITEDSEYMLFTIVPEYKLVREQKLNNAGMEKIPRDILGIYSIKSGELDTIVNIRNYRIPEKWTGCVAYQADKCGGESGYLNKKTTAGKAELDGNGFRLYLRHFTIGNTVSWPFVTEYVFSEITRELCFASTGNETGFEAGIYLYNCETGKTDTVIRGEKDYRRVTFSGDGKMISFLARPRIGNKLADFSLFLWSRDGAAKEIVNTAMKEVPSSWRINENGNITFSENGQRIFFGIAPVRPVRDSSILIDEYPGVDIWHGSEGLLHTVQLVNKDQDLRRTYLTIYEINDGRLLQIETEEIPQSGLIDNGNADQVFLYTGKPYELQSMWNPLLYDVYLLDLKTGTKQLIKKNVRSIVSSSPRGEYLIWFNYNDYSWCTYHIKTGKEYRITEPGTIRAEIETNTTFDVNEPYGSPGWLNDDRAVLIYDRYDIWKVDPQNLTPPVNLTVNGRKSNIVYRLIKFNLQQGSFNEKEMHYLTGVNESTRATGYYLWGMKKPTEPEMLTGGDYNLSSPLKAEKSNTVVYTKETFEVFPDLIVSDLSFRDQLRISDANPHQKDFSWGTAEIYEWTSLDGRKLEGMLFKPEGFDPSRKYPMIVTFFHKSSGELFNHRVPEYHRSRIDYHSYTSNGYIIFNPDIYFDEGYVGESAYKSVMPGVTALIDEGFVDPERIGAAGHSYSGYQVAYLATRTNMFACIEAGAPVVNFFSAYGGIRWETGRSRAAQYEHDQTLATIWEAPLRFLENSPVFAMDKINTPILIMHNDADGAVPWYQGIEFFIALRRMNKPVWLLNYNGEPHNLIQLKNMKDFQIRLRQFFDHYLKGTPMPEWMYRGVPATEKDYNLGYKLLD